MATCHAMQAAKLLFVFCFLGPFLTPAFAEDEVPPLPPALQRCIDLTTAAGAACRIESDTMSLVYYRDARQLPTVEEATMAISRMRAAAQPTEGCCRGLLPYVESRCPCDPGYQDVVPLGGYSPAYFEGATRILAVACKQDFPPCIPNTPSWSPSAASPPGNDASETDSGGGGGGNFVASSSSDSGGVSSVPPPVVEAQDSGGGSGTRVILPNAAYP